MSRKKLASSGGSARVERTARVHRSRVARRHYPEGSPAGFVFRICPQGLKNLTTLSGGDYYLKGIGRGKSRAASEGEMYESKRLPPHREKYKTHS